MRRGILATREELKALADRVGRHPYGAIYETLDRRCSLILQTNPITEAQWRSLWHQGSWASALLAARTTQGRILDLLIAHHIDANPAYHSRAIEELKNLISWSTWTDPSHQTDCSCGDRPARSHPNHLPADLCTAEAAVAATVALDWLWEDLSEADRHRVVKALHVRAIEPYQQGVQQGVSWYNTYSNTNAVVNSGCGLAALALAEDSPAAAEAYQAARNGLKRFFDALGREGGWDEGTGYWGLAMRYVLLFGHAVSRVLDDQTILHQRGMDATGLFPIYFTPNGQPASFGDNPAVPLYGTFYLLVQHHGLSELTWWLDTYSFHRDVSSSGWSAAGLALLFRPVDADCPKQPDLQPLKVFHEIGWAAMADAWPRPRLYVAAKTGDLSASHSQHDMNSIQLQVDGEMLLVDLGHPPLSAQYLSEPRKQFYEVQPQAHNTLVVGGRDHSIDAQGSILEARSDDKAHWLVMDSAGACGDNVEFIRHVVMLWDTHVKAPGDAMAKTGEAVVILDEINIPAPEKAELYWHTLGKVEWDKATATGTIRGQGARLYVALQSSAKMHVATATHRLPRQRTDHIICLSAKLTGKTYIASVFSRRPLSGPVQMQLDQDAVVLTCGERKLPFKKSKRYLVLSPIEAHDTKRQDV